MECVYLVHIIISPNKHYLDADRINLELYPIIHHLEDCL